MACGIFSRIVNDASNLILLFSWRLNSLLCRSRLGQNRKAVHGSRTFNQYTTQRNLNITFGSLKSWHKKRALKQEMLNTCGPPPSQMRSKLLHSWTSSTRRVSELMDSSSIGASGVAVETWVSVWTGLVWTIWKAIGWVMKLGVDFNES